MKRYGLFYQLLLVIVLSFYYTKALELNPQFLEAYYNRGQAWNRKNELDRAISDFTHALNINPRFNETYFNRSRAFLKSGNLKKALDDAKKAFALSPDNKSYGQFIKDIESKMQDKPSAKP